MKKSNSLIVKYSSNIKNLKFQFPFASFEKILIKLFITQLEQYRMLKNIQAIEVLKKRENIFYFLRYKPNFNLFIYDLKYNKEITCNLHC